ncbi:MAG: hypothetical protein KME16_16040 [Scytolyngbya sp. HA4215-MV1]|nr:hypothetical protein [Scytolyngbya sp. HA4215-MV1]
MIAILPPTGGSLGSHWQRLPSVLRLPVVVAANCAHCRHKLPSPSGNRHVRCQWCANVPDNGHDR